MDEKGYSQQEVLVTIRYVAKNGQEDTVQVNQFPYLIGRDSSSVQLALPDATVSRTHARVICQDGIVSLENISTTNKTAVNGQYIDRPVPLRSGDQAILGSCKLFFEIRSVVREEKSESDDETVPIDDFQVLDEDTPKKIEPAPVEPVSIRPSQNDASKTETCYCWKCGEVLPAGAAFCANCGAAVRTKIMGQPMQPVFCGSCGAKIDFGSQFCPQCGKSTGQGVQQQNTSQAASSSAPSSSTAPRKRRKALIPVIAAILMAGVIAILAVTLLGSRSYESVVRQYIDATFEGDYVKIWNLLPKELREGVLNYYGISNIKDIEDLEGIDFMKEIDEALKRAAEEFGDNWKYSYEIIDEENYSRGELDMYKQVLRVMGGNEDIKIDEGKQLKIELTISGKDGRTEEDVIYIDVLKIGRSWYLGSFS